MHHKFRLECWNFTLYQKLIYFNFVRMKKSIKNFIKINFKYFHIYTGQK